MRDIVHSKLWTHQRHHGVKTRHIFRNEDDDALRSCAQYYRSILLDVSITTAGGVFHGSLKIQIGWVGVWWSWSPSSNIMANQTYDNLVLFICLFIYLFIYLFFLPSIHVQLPGCSNLGSAKKLFTIPKRPNRFRVPPRLLFNGYQGSFPGGKTALA